MESKDTFYIKEALKQAKKGETKDEVPVGCILIKNGIIIARAYNKKEKTNNAINHAEIVAITKATKKLQNWYLDGVTAYVTLEPCPMCIGAFINSRIDRLVFGAYDYKSGACGSVVDLTKEKLFNHNIKVLGGVMEKECGEVLTHFFKNKRNKR